MFCMLRVLHTSACDVHRYISKRQQTTHINIAIACPYASSPTSAVYRPLKFIMSATDQS